MASIVWFSIERARGRRWKPMIASQASEALDGCDRVSELKKTLE